MPPTGVVVVPPTGVVVPSTGVVVVPPTGVVVPPTGVVVITSPVVVPGSTGVVTGGNVVTSAGITIIAPSMSATGNLLPNSSIINVSPLSHVIGYVPSSQSAGTLNVSVNTVEPSFATTPYSSLSRPNATKLALAL